MNDLKELKIKNFVLYQDYCDASKVSKNYIKIKKIDKEYNNSIIYNFNISYSNQQIKVRNNKIIDVKCDCFRFGYYNSCIHVAAILYNYYDYIKTGDMTIIDKEISLGIMNELKVNRSNEIKKKCDIEIDIKAESNYSFLNLKIGEKRKYCLKPKANSFFNCYYNNGCSVKFGKEFIYSSDKYYFSDEDKKIIDFAYDIYASQYKNNDFILTEYKLREILELKKEKNISVNGIKVFEIKEYTPSTTLDKKDNNYNLSFDLNFDNILPLSNSFKYIFYINKILILKDDFAKLLKSLLYNNINKLVFNDTSIFSNSVLPIVRNNIEVTENVKDIVIIKKPKTKLYFDLNSKKIKLDIKFEYKDKTISYYEKDEEILRDTEYEEKVKNEMLELGFIIEKDKFILKDIDEIGYLLEEELIKLKDKYEVYTSEKLDKVNIVKKSNIKSTFSIGRDNILKFDFNIDNIGNDELIDIFDSLNKKKKYYKLKSGNYLDLTNDKLLELKSLTEEINLSNKDILSNDIKIPKYRAIYLDSLSNKYSIITKDNLFNKFITNFKEYKNIDLKLTKEEKNILRDYQEVGVKWLYNIYKCDLGGILADEMGLGKSLQTLYLIKKILKEKKDAKILIVTPTSLCYNWEREIQKFTPNLKYHVFTETKNIRKENLKNKKINVYITSYGLLREDIEYYKEQNFEIFIIDEAQNIKNPTSLISKSVKIINARTKLALTGTPLENSLTELFSIFDFIMPGFFNSLNDFNHKYSFKDFESDKDKLELLNNQIKPFILRRKKENVIKDLPPKMENNIYIELEETQKEIYASMVEKTKNKMDELIKEEGFTKSRFEILKLLTRLRQICIDPKIIFENYDKESSKIVEVIKVIKELKENNHKILLFSSFRTALSIIEKELNKNKISYYLIDGSVSSIKRMELVDKFNSDDTTVFLIMLKAGGTGLNLTSADTVIHLDLWWNPQAENQATDRAHRIGQKKIVEVIKFISKGTIEERILELQEKKKKLSDSIIEGNTRDQNLIGTLSERDIKELLS